MYTSHEQQHEAMLAALKRERPFHERVKASRQKTGVMFGRRDEGGIIRHVPTPDNGPPPASTQTLYIKSKGDSRWSVFDPESSG